MKPLHTTDSYSPRAALRNPFLEISVTLAEQQLPQATQVKRFGR
jgi:hypothetical protein